MFFRGRRQPRRKTKQGRGLAMTDSEDIAALRQEVENWKLIAIEQGRRLDIIARRLNTPCDDEHFPTSDDDMRVASETDLWQIKFRWRIFERDFDNLSSLVRWIEARLVAIEKQPGIVPKKGWIEAKTLSIGTVDDDMMARQAAAMKNIDPS